MKTESIRRQLREMGVPEDKAGAAALKYGAESRIPTPSEEKHKAIARAARRKQRDQHEREFRLWCKVNGLPNPASEHVFAKGTHGRMWKFDWAWGDPDTSGGVALEIEGGVYSGGRHVRGKGYENDMEKYSTAATLGWRLVRTTPAKLYSEETLAMLTKLLVSSTRAA